MRSFDVDVVFFFSIRIKSIHQDAKIEFPILFFLQVRNKSITHLARSYPAAPADPRTGSRALGTSFLTRSGGNSAALAGDAPEVGVGVAVDFDAIVASFFSAGAEAGAMFSRREPLSMIL